MRRPLTFAAALLLLLTALTACTGREPRPPASAGPSGSAGQLPPADGLLREAAAELRDLRTVRFEISTNGGDLLGIRSASGRVTAAGEADGKVRLDQTGVASDLSFVVKPPDLYVKGLAAGGWQRLPLAAAAAVYDPSALLSPERGLARLVGTAHGTTEAREELGGVPTYRIRGTLAGAGLAVLVPGLSSDATGTLWVGTDRRLLHQARFAVPGQSGEVTVTFSDFDAPVTVVKP
ncbi:LppX_LprAFG lipoprotein [Micromonospora sp. NPDC049559]|uniref:LppX_LprAFG lipoprotein n=1 Tax=Micromonospora sp. NPDC049559 TaxID=3155923 RepID=UPI0034287D7D